MEDRLSKGELKSFHAAGILLEIKIHRLGIEQSISLWRDVKLR